LYSSNLRPHFSRITHLAWPLIVSNITVPLLGLVDTAVLGHLDSPVFLAAVAIGANLFSIVYFAFGFLRMGTTGQMAQAWAQGHIAQVHGIFFHNTTIAILIGVGLIAIQSGLFSLAIFLVAGDGESSELAKTYCSIRALGAPAALGVMVVVGSLIAVQQPKLTLLLMVVVNLLNILLDLWLVVALNWQLQGVAWATVVANYVAWLVGCYVIQRKLGITFDSLRNHQPFDISALRNVMGLNRDIFIRTVLLMSVFLLMIWRGAQLGDTVLAANAVLMTFFFLLSNALDGFANATESTVGSAIGQRDSHALRGSVHAAALLSLLVAVGFSLFFWLFGQGLIHLLSDLPEVTLEAARYLPWMVLLPLTTVTCFLMDGVFIGATQGRAMKQTMAVSVLLVFVPALLLFYWWGNHGLWLALNVFMVARGATLAHRYKRLDDDHAWF
jgi:MATE family multidrug resistance protein